VTSSSTEALKRRRFSKTHSAIGAKTLILRRRRGRLFPEIRAAIWANTIVGTDFIVDLASRLSQASEVEKLNQGYVSVPEREACYEATFFVRRFAHVASVMPYMNCKSESLVHSKALSNILGATRRYLSSLPNDFEWKSMSRF
jgi:hypothetical protein